MVFLNWIKNNWILYRSNQIVKAFNKGKVEWSENVKRALLISLCTKNKISVFVETGTYKGKTALALSRFVAKVFTMELDEILFEHFSNAQKVQNIQFFQGNSLDVLPKILESLPNERVLFWLDAHYSGLGTSRGSSITPIEAEVEIIARGEKKFNILIVVIDDIRLFNKIDDYPDIKEFTTKLHQLFPRYNQFFVGDVLILQT